MATARYLERTGQSPGWVYVTFFNHVEEVDLSAQAWPVVERRAAGNPALPVTDNTLVRLRGFGNLRALNLGDSRVTDAGIRELKRLTHLETLDISGTQISDVGVHELRAALPNCRVLN
jgi:Leucine-rich repeat (LRR) protein